MDKWTAYEAGDDGYIPMERFGHDHWSTFAYLETCVVDVHGYIDNRRMRCNARLHREFAWRADGSDYPTRLKDGEQARHDDWSCLEDMAAAGLIRAWWREPAGEFFGGGQARVELTERGQEIAAQLREHKAAGHPYATFVPIEVGHAETVPNM